ncbi:MAG TPA: DUF2842 domain-containing protein [Rhizomicrobium sp.]|jgi:hypothetical protein|nr:DUF2842 domain-containing protein [Rhizomicrobium sp.]
MTPHSKKLIGTIVILLWLPLYALIAMSVGVRVLPHAAWFAAVLYYALAGTLWIIPIGLMLPWMHRERTGGQIS